MRRYSLTANRLIFAIAATVIASLAVVASAQAVVVTFPSGPAHYGVALAPA